MDQSYDVEKSRCSQQQSSPDCTWSRKEPRYSRVGALSKDRANTPRSLLVYELDLIGASEALKRHSARDLTDSRFTHSRNHSYYFSAFECCVVAGHATDPSRRRWKIRKLCMNQPELLNRKCGNMNLGKTGLPIACDLNALTSEERDRRQIVLGAITRTTSGRAELANGFQLRFDAARLDLAALVPYFAGIWAFAS